MSDGLPYNGNLPPGYSGSDNFGAGDPCERCGDPICESCGHCHDCADLDEDCLEFDDPIGDDDDDETED